jgi:pimeloyl-ACP methyl ester carboxylesterase
MDTAMNNEDVVVVLPGIMGSTLGVRGKDGSPAGDNLFWAPSGGAVWKLLTRRDSILDHELPEGIGDSHPDDGVEPVGLMPDVHAIPGIWTPLKGYDVLVNHLRSLGYHEATGDRPANLVLAPYDWRLSNRYNGQRLSTIVEPALERWRAQGGQYADARVVFVCHSMGGLVARWYIERCGGHEVTRKLITLGTPWRGATNAIEQLVNGVRKGVGPLSINLTGFARSLPSLHQLMPEFACIANGSEFLKTTETTVPELKTDMVKDAMAFQTDLQESERGRADSRGIAHIVVGIRQPTNTTVRLANGRATVSETFGSENDYGDGTVPLTGAIGHDERLDTNIAVRVPENHSALQCNRFVLDQVQELLTASPVRRRDLSSVSVRARVPDLVVEGEPLEVAVDTEVDADAGPLGAGPPSSLAVMVSTERGTVIAREVVSLSADGSGRASFEELPPGTHTVTVAGATPAAGVRTVTSSTMVWPTMPG